MDRSICGRLRAASRAPCRSHAVAVRRSSGVRPRHYGRRFVLRRAPDPTGCRHPCHPRAGRRRSDRRWRRAPPGGPSGSWSAPRATEWGTDSVRRDRHRTRLPVPPRIRASLRECGRRVLERGRQRFRLPQMVDRRADRPHASRRNLHVGRGRPLPPRGARGRNDDVPGPAAASRSAELNSRRHNAHRGGCAFCLLCRAPDRVSLRRDRHLERDRPLVLDVRAPRLLRAHRGGRACRRPPLRG